MSRDSVIKSLIDIENHERELLDSVQSPLGSNNVKYNTAFYGQEVSDPTGKNYRWCVVFQWWCCQKAGIPTSVFPKSAGVFAVRDWFKERGRFFSTPMKGDLVIFEYSHIGLVEKLLENNRFQTIEGNKDDRVKRIIHSRGEGDIEGYCRPEYEKAEEVDVTEAELRKIVNQEIVRALDHSARTIIGIESWEAYLKALLDAARAH